MKTIARGKPATTSLRLVACPECAGVARIEWSDVADGTGGPVEMVKLQCMEGHWFLLPSEALHRL
jgi:hypothetical protein